MDTRKAAQERLENNEEYQRVVGELAEAHEKIQRMKSMIESLTKHLRAAQAHVEKNRV